MINFVRNNRTASGFAAAAAAFLLALCAGLLVWAPPAAAHDELTGSSPADGAVLEAPPESVELVFSNNPAAIGSRVQVLDAAGTDWADGDVRILDNTATQPLRSSMPAGTYTVNWRVVSSDAHPIGDGESFTFTVRGGTSAGTSAPATAVPSAGASAPSTAAPLPDATQSPVLNRSDDPGSPWPVIVPAAVVLAAVAVLIALSVRRRLRED
ncbi:copper resistance CopC family protein [Arthrobacter zhaoxinii]|uniref:copper resistance CopC family protein n=1 Tax=Arthrobacter zhaoxinii TaxID=2964616 RepID=UPI00210745C2|nr:copper resistance CopC family protein [Arthrobacter zhaoxinii]MCQ2000309.1 copper resistance protein CopC [Arthrobacter zhaoxinii]